MPGVARHDNKNKMPTYYQKYRAELKNKEGQVIIINIYDKLSGDVDPYSMSIDVQDAGGGNILVRNFFSNLPGTATDVLLGYSSDGGATWTDTSVGLTSPGSITIPNTFAYIYRQTVVYADPSLNEVFNMDDLDGVTDTLTPGGDPCRLIVNNNSEDKMSPIAGMQLVMQFNAQDNALLNKLLRGTYSDKRYYVTAEFEAVTGYFFFKGYLNLADTTEPFLPRPQITFTASDGLGSLKNKKLKDFTGANPSGKHKLIKFISWCLQQTGVEENFHVVFNVREEEDGSIAAEPDKHCFNTQYLDAKTWEAEVGESDDCYTVLSNLLKYLGKLGQRHGTWWFKNFDEYDTQPDYVAVFDSDGEFVEALDGAYYNKEIGITKSMKWSGHSCKVSFSSPHKMAKLTQRFETPKEVPCNIDFLRGTIFSDTPTLKKYSIECWTKLYTDGTGDHASAANMYIETQWLNGYEINRYLHFEDNGVFNFIMSEGIPMKAGDRAEINVNRRMESNHGTAGVDNCVQLRLYGNDGTFWTHHGKTPTASPDADVAYWVQCDSLFQTNKKYHCFNVADDYDDTESTSLYSGEVGPLPVAGEVKMLIYMSSLYGMTEDTYIEDASFEYLPYINGSFQKYTGQHHKVERTDGDNESVDDDVFVDNLPASLLKGALHKWNGSKYVLSGRFWNAAVHTTPPDETYLHPFGYIRAFNVWNQVRLLNRIFRGSIQGIESDTVDGRGRSDLPSIFHSYKMTDTDEHSNDKKFMLLNYDMDLYRCEFRNASFKEVFNEVVPKDYADPYEFKYLTR